MMELGELVKSVKELFNLDDISKLGEVLTESMNDEKKKEAFAELIDNDFSVDWLQMIFQYYNADRKEKKQDYTPKCLAKFLSRLIGDSTETIDMCAGSGALTIQRWIDNPDTSFILYEIDENVIPFLLFNLALRNINATIYQSDVLQNETIRSWKIQKGDRFGKVVNIESSV